MRLARTLLALAILILVTAPGLRTQPADSISLYYVGSTLWNCNLSETIDVEVAGHYAYCVFPYGVVTLDVTDPDHLVEVSRQFLGFYPRMLQLEISGDIAYVTHTNFEFDYAVYGWRVPAKLTTLDLSNPGMPRTLAELELPTTVSTDYTIQPRDMAIVGNTLIITCQDSGLVIVDVQTPSAPAVIGRYQTPGSAMGIAVAGDYAFVSCARGYPKKGCLLALDISDPSAPDSVGAYTPDTYTRQAGVTVFGDLVYMQHENGPVYVVDITDPTLPFGHSNFDAHGDFYIVGGYLYVGRWNSAADIYDLDHPHYPPLVASTPYTGRYGLEGRVAVADDVLYVASGYGLWAYRVPDPTAPVPADSAFTLASTGIGDVVVDGQIAYVADASRGLRSVDVSRKSAPRPLGVVSLQHPDEPYDGGEIALSGDFAYVACENDPGTLVVDVSDPMQPRRQTVLYGYVKDVAVDGDRLYVADQDAGLRIYDISNPGSPIVLGRTGAVGPGWGVDAEGDYAYVVTGPRMVIVDVSSPELPVVVGSHSPPDTYVHEIHVTGDTAYLPVDEWGLEVVDVSDPTSPAVLGSFTRPGFFPRQVTTEGNLAFAATTSGVTVLDISDLSNIQWVADFDTPGRAFTVQKSGNYLYVADDAGLLILGMLNTRLDLNCDGALDLADVILIGNVLDGITDLTGTCGEGKADIDGDGDVDEDDYNALFDLMAGMGP